MANQILKVEALSLCPKKGVASLPCGSIEIQLEGLVGDRHIGFAKKADGRDTGVKRGTPVRNWRQWSAVSLEDLQIIAQRLEIAELTPELLGANIAFSGMEGFTSIPRGSTIWLPDGGILSVEEENAPCIGPGKEIAKHFVEVNASQFCKAANGLRGLVGVVFQAGKITVGDMADLRVARA